MRMLNLSFLVGCLLLFPTVASAQPPTETPPVEFTFPDNTEKVLQLEDTVEELKTKHENTQSELEALQLQQKRDAKLHEEELRKALAGFLTEHVEPANGKVEKALNEAQSATHIATQAKKAGETNYQWLVFLTAGVVAIAVVGGYFWILYLVAEGYFDWVRIPKRPQWSYRRATPPSAPREETVLEASQRFNGAVRNPSSAAPATKHT